MKSTPSIEPRSDDVTRTVYNVEPRWERDYSLWEHEIGAITVVKKTIDERGAKIGRRCGDNGHNNIIMTPDYGG